MKRSERGPPATGAPSTGTGCLRLGVGFATCFVLSWVSNLGALEFANTKSGRPHLGDGPLRFSVARSGGVVLFGFARGTEVGVDVERIRTNADVYDIAARFFAVDERAALAALSERERLEATFRCWRGDRDERWAPDPGGPRGGFDTGRRARWRANGELELVGPAPTPDQLSVV